MMRYDFPISNMADFDYTDQSKWLYSRTLVQSTMDPQNLHTIHLKKLERLKTFANGDAVLYESRNPSGNSKCSLGLNTSARSDKLKACYASQNRFKEKAKSNPQLKYFFTGTFDPKKNDLSDPSKLLTRLTRFFRRRGIDYMLVAEPHKSGQIHFHGLTSDISSMLEPFDLSKPLPRSLINYISSGHDCFNFPAYAKLFGYVSVAPIRDFDKCINYVSKYIAKEFLDGSKRFFKKRFVCSTGLNMPQFEDPTKIDFSNYTPTHFSRFAPKVFLTTRNKKPVENAPTTSNGFITPIYTTNLSLNDLPHFKPLTHFSARTGCDDKSHWSPSLDMASG